MMYLASSKSSKQEDRFMLTSYGGTLAKAYPKNSQFALSYLRMLINIWLLWGAFGLQLMHVFHRIQLTSFFKKWYFDIILYSYIDIILYSYIDIILYSYISAFTHTLYTTDN